MSSLFSALTVAVGGLTAQSESLGNISDNLSNAQTTGFKSIGTNFESLVTVSNASTNEPGGVRATPSYENDVQGNLVQSNTATSLAISGQGFFAVETAAQNADGSTSFTGNTLFTREGDFTLDKNGYLVNGSGYYLLGNNVDNTGTVNQASTNPIQVSALLNNPVATTTAAYDANLPSSAIDTFTSTPSTVQVYDALGNTHDMTFTWTKVSANIWDLGVSIPSTTNGSGVTTPYSATVPFTFNSSSNVGTVATIASGTGYTVPNLGKESTDPAADVTLSGLTFDGLTSAQSITVNFGNYNTATGLTQFSGSNVAVTSFSQNGLPQGSFKDLAIDNSGNVSINYSNGSTRVIAQIPIVQFYAQDQLQRVTGNAYEATITSGTPRYAEAGTNGGGTIASNSLESSNVDIATQFTDMIEAQQIYSANAKTITTVDNMLNTVIQTVQ